jgi:hypothetical protein
MRIQESENCSKSRFMLHPSYNKALKSALAVWGQAFEEAKAHSFAGASAPGCIPLVSVQECL